MKTYYVYILTNAHNTTFYIGFTSNLVQRVWRHKTRFFKNSFSDRYNVHKLVYYEEINEVYSAISREKQLKKWRRTWKIELVRQENPNFKDLAEGWY